MLAAIDSRVPLLCAMAPQSYWSKWAGSCEDWASNLIKWRESAADGKACTQEMRVCSGARVPVRIGCDQVCPEAVGGGTAATQVSQSSAPSSVAGCLFQAGPVCVNVPILAAAALLAYFAWGRS